MKVPVLTLLCTAVLLTDVIEGSSMSSASSQSTAEEASSEGSSEGSSTGSSQGSSSASSEEAITLEHNTGEFYRGCFIDDPDDPDLPKAVVYTRVIPRTCIVKCGRAGFKYAGVQKGNLCFCGDKFGKHGQAETTNCNTPCDFVATERCGGTNMNDIYDTGVGGYSRGGEGVCGCYGDPHCKSFDGKWTHYQNICRYTMVRDNCGGTLPSTNVPTFKVSALFWKKNRPTTAVSWVKEVFVEISGDTFVIKQGLEVTKNGVTIVIPYDQDNIVITKLGGLMTLHHIPTGLKVYFDGKQNFQTFLPEAFNGQTCGFCGNKDGNPDNDWQLGPTCKEEDSFYYGPLTLNMNLFGVSWTEPDSEHFGQCVDCHVDPPTSPCSNDAAQNEASMTCGEIPVVLQDCFDEMTVEEQDGFMIGCIYDYCNDGPDTVCDIFVDLAGYCLNEYNVLEDDWGSFERCVPECTESNEEYRRCGFRTNDRTCYEVLTAPFPALDEQCTSGCFCKEGYVRNSNQECVLPEECGCVYGTVTLEVGDHYYDDELCKAIQCGDSGTTVVDEADCDENAHCVQSSIDDVECVCNERFTGDGMTCEEIDCGPPSSVDHMTAAYDETKLDDTATYTCDLGYTPDGDGTVVCEESGWSTLSYSCTVDCGPPPASCTAESSNVGDEAECGCDDGYEATGNTSIVCQADGDWSDSEHNCHKACSDSNGHQWIQLDPSISTSYYYFKGKDVKNERANIKCENNGGMLVKIETYEENQMLWEHIKNNGGNRWIALRVDHDTGIEYWNDSPGVQANFTNWADGEPNDHTGEGGESCVQLLMEDGKWNDVECVKTIQVICEMEECGGWWSEWVLWSECDVTCGDGAEEYHRRCYGEICPGGEGNYETKTVACERGPCPVDGNWGEWTPWGSCQQTCGEETITYNRSCNNPAPSANGQPCSGDDEKTESCGLDPCPVDGNWGEWTPWGSCQQTCGEETLTYNRTCDNPAPSANGQPCSGDDEKTESCGHDQCPVDGNWGEWTPWGSCQQTCGEETLTYNRTCDNPAPSANGQPCSGDDEKTESCGHDQCPVDGNWGEWTPWGSCQQTCGEETLTYNRTCDNPAPSANGQPCSGDDEKTESCGHDQCPVDGNWGEWTPWGSCQQTCGEETFTYNRTCDNPAPSANGQPCSGDNEKTESCGHDQCPVDGNWGEWTPWGSCQQTCGEETLTYNRTCDNPAPSANGQPCSGDDEKTESCGHDQCPEIECEDPEDIDNMSYSSEGNQVGNKTVYECDDGFEDNDEDPEIECLSSGNWSHSYFACTKVDCESPPDGCTAEGTEYGDKATCECDDGHTTSGNTTIVCQANGNWSEHEHNCSRVNCGDVPEQCTASDTKYLDEAECECPEGYITTGNTIRVCQEDGNWSDKKYNCTEIECEDPEDIDNMSYSSEGNQVGDKTVYGCDDGFEDNGEDPEIECLSSGNWSHSNFACTINGNWGEWTPWGSCQQTCGEETITYNRLCDNPAPSANGQPCSGDDEKTESCGHDPCPDHCDCPDNTECIEADDGSYICKCLMGFMGDCEVCVDIDECATETDDCPKHGVCVNTVGSYTCDCRDGFEKKGTKCVDVNECREDSDDCPDHSACVNTLGDFDCICCNGYEDDGNGGCAEAGDVETTGQDCCVCSGKICNEEGLVCGGNDHTYSSMRALIIAECEQQTDIGVNYKGECQDSCSGVECPSRYQECVMVEGKATCQCEGCSPSDNIDGPICSSEYQFYDNLCHFKNEMCEYDLDQEAFPNTEPCDDTDRPVGEWSDWGDCSVECGKGTKTRTRDIIRTLYGNEVDKYPPTVSADCYKEPCPGGPCDGYDCEGEGAECFVNQNDEAECECPSCAGEGKDPVCGIVGGVMQTFTTLCRLQRRACRQDDPYELLYEGPCTDKPLDCARRAKFEKIAIDETCVSQNRQLQFYCDGGCGDDPEKCCEARNVTTKYLYQPTVNAFLRDRHKVELTVTPPVELSLLWIISSMALFVVISEDDGVIRYNTGELKE
ncbi:hypothetical protein ScPMuIL_013213 [Solemya velum]